MNIPIRKIAAEFLGVAFILAATVGASFSASAFGPVAIAAVYALMLLVAAPISGGHLNPAVSLFFLARRKMSLADFGWYLLAQFTGALAGVWLGGALWGVLSLSVNPGIATTKVSLLSEAVGTAVLVAIFGQFASLKLERLIPVAAAGWFFAVGIFGPAGAILNPAATFASIFAAQGSISAAQAGGFVVAQVFGTLIAVIVLGFVFGPKRAGKAKGKKKAKKAKKK